MKPSNSPTLWHHATKLTYVRTCFNFTDRVRWTFTRVLAVMRTISGLEPLQTPSRMMTQSNLMPFNTRTAHGDQNSVLNSDFCKDYIWTESSVPVTAAAGPLASPLLLWHSGPLAAHTPWTNLHRFNVAQLDSSWHALEVRSPCRNSALFIANLFFNKGSEENIKVSIFTYRPRPKA